MRIWAGGLITWCEKEFAIRSSDDICHPHDLSGGRACVALILIKCLRGECVNDYARVQLIRVWSMICHRPHSGPGNRFSGIPCKQSKVSMGQIKSPHLDDCLDLLLVVVILGTLVKIWIYVYFIFRTWQNNFISRGLAFEWSLFLWLWHV